MPQQKNYYVYLLSNWNDKVLYIGVTNNLERRIVEHRQKLVPGFTEKYNVNKLVYFEQTNDVISAISREKQLKKWRRIVGWAKAQKRRAQQGRTISWARCRFAQPTLIALCRSEFVGWAKAR